MRRFRPNAAARAAFAESMRALESWIDSGDHDGAERASTGTVYFTLDGRRYRVSSHKPGFNYNGEICFHAAPTRAPEIAKNIRAGVQLDGRGNRKEST